MLVHGLRGDRQATWTHNTSKICWPEHLLPDALRNRGQPCRILTFGYDADPFRFVSAVSQNCLRDHAKALVNGLGGVRYDDGTLNRPIIFVAHSLGGLLCEQALLISRSFTTDFARDVLHSTRGIVFMGTPHYGSSKASFMKSLEGILKVNPRRGREQPLLDILRPSSETLATLQQEFHQLLEERKKEPGKTISIYCFFEAYKDPHFGEVGAHQGMCIGRRADDIDRVETIRHLDGIRQRKHSSDSHRDGEVRRPSRQWFRRCCETIATLLGCHSKVAASSARA